MDQIELEAGGLAAAAETSIWERSGSGGRARREFCVCFSHATAKIETTVSACLLLSFLDLEWTKSNHKLGGCVAAVEIGFWE